MKYFYWRKLKFDISNKNIYPPKPASLLLAKIATQRIKPGQTVLDACTGCGVVAIAIDHFVKNTKVFASDIYPPALDVARKNTKINNVNIIFKKSNLYSAFKNRKFDVIIVHPPAIPYLPNQTWGMPAGMNIATNGGPDGSRLVIRAIKEAKKYLKPEGKLLLLLPHWSNRKKAYNALNKYYKNYQELAKLKVEFFPLKESKPNTKILKHAQRLAKNGIIELDFKKKKAFSHVSVIETRLA